jgi:hypothetical protein
MYRIRTRAGVKSTFTLYKQELSIHVQSTTVLSPVPTPIFPFGLRLLSSLITFLPSLPFPLAPRSSLTLRDQAKKSGPGSSPIVVHHTRVISHTFSLEPSRSLSHRHSGIRSKDNLLEEISLATTLSNDESATCLAPKGKPIETRRKERRKNSPVPTVLLPL